MPGEPRRLGARWASVLFGLIVPGVFALLLVLHLRAPFSAFIVSGNSMEPDIHTGDLALVRAQRDGYAVGDAVAYRHRDLGPVLHRIVGETSEGFVLQGDNREGPDAYAVPAKDVLGVLLVRIPAVGKALEGAGGGRALAGLATIGVAASLAGGLTGWRHHRRTGEAKRGLSRAAHDGEGRLLRGEQFAVTPQGVHIAAGMAAAALVALGVVAAVTAFGTAGPAASRENYEHRGSFTYAAQGAPGVYDAPAAQTGDPIFRRLADTIEVGFQYEFWTVAVANVSGQYRMDLRLTQANGWNRTLEIVPTTPFQGVKAEVSGVIDLHTVQSVIDAMEQQTGIGSRAYLLTLIPRIELDGTLAGQELHDRFVPEQRFLLDQQVLQPQPSAGSNDVKFDRVQNGNVAVSRMGERALHVVGLRILFKTVRSAAFLTLGITLPGLLGWMVATTIIRRGDEAALIEAQYRDVLVRGHIDQLPANPTVIGVDSMEDLVRLAEQRDVPVIAEYAGSDEAAPEFVVISPDGVTYYYRPRPGSHRRSEGPR
ncbi:MAG: signal peptidase I [Dehalococcoidia bacterium]|nr:MAG: signal peptidase I [Dehalococcoidia bacterium]